LPAQQATKYGARELNTLRLFNQEVTEERIAGEIATHNRVEGDAGTSGKASLGKQGRWNAGGATLAKLDNYKRVVEGHGEGTVEAVQVGRVGDLVRVRD
jgi:hypothetical protein